MVRRLMLPEISNLFWYRCKACNNVNTNLWELATPGDVVLEASCGACDAPITIQLKEKKKTTKAKNKFKGNRRKK
jgi:hypothetical protein